MGYCASYVSSSPQAQSVQLSPVTDCSLRTAASIVPYSAFPTSDSTILLGGGNDNLFRILCQRLNQPSWAEDERFATNSARVSNRDVLESMIAEETRKRSTREWLEALDGSGMPYAAVNDVKDTLESEHGEQTWSPADILLVVQVQSTGNLGFRRDRQGRVF